jgi:2'-5' RNA ligase
MSFAQPERQLPLFDHGLPAPAGAGGMSWQEKLYFALRPDFGTARRMAAVGEQLIRDNGLSGRLRPLDMFHVSVLGVGFYHELSKEEIAIAEAAARAIAFAPFGLSFTQAMSYPKNRGRHPLVLHAAAGAEQVNQLAMALGTAMVARGFRPRGQPTGSAHLTLLYDALLLPATPLEVPIELDVSRLFLVRNHHGQSRHENQMFAFRS